MNGAVGELLARAVQEQRRHVGERVLDGLRAVATADETWCCRCRRRSRARAAAGSPSCAAPACRPSPRSGRCRSWRAASRRYSRSVSASDPPGNSSASGSACPRSTAASSAAQRRVSVELRFAVRELRDQGVGKTHPDRQPQEPRPASWRSATQSARRHQHAVFAQDRQHSLEQTPVRRQHPEPLPQRARLRCLARA